MISCIVNQNIDMPLLGSNTVNQLLRVLRIGNIKGVELCVPLELVENPLRFRAADDADRRSRTHQAARNTEAKPGCAAGNNCDLSIQIVPSGHIELFQLFFCKCGHFLPPTSYSRT